MPTLTWTGKEDALRAASLVPFRLLEPHAAAESGIVGDPKAAFAGGAGVDNLLIQGDNLEALKALLPYYAGRVKCIYIDPPYNTGSAFEHYDDNLEHSTWLSMMYPRLELLRELLAEEGSIWISIDEREAQYLKVAADEVFGRSNFITSVIWQKIFTIKNSAKYLSEMHDYVLVYAKSAGNWNRNLLPRSERLDDTYSNPDNDLRGPWTTNAIQARNFYSQGSYTITSPSGREFLPPPGTYWRVSRQTFDELNTDGRVYWGRDGQSIPRIKKFLSEAKQGVVPATVWMHGDVGTNAEAKVEVRSLFADVADADVFITPKPERLIKHILEIASNPGDLVLDSFLGSGTTPAVAHKMGRRWIGIEMGDHAVTHCLPRLQKVIEGEQGGISEAVSWKGGGGFRFVKLGETVFQPDGSLNPKVSFKALAAHIWWRETGKPLADTPATPLIGTHEGKAFYLLYNGILGDKRPEAGNVLTPTVLSRLPTSGGQKIIFAEACLIPTRNLERLGIIFRQVPYDLGGLHA
jgi:adenine-specific DNA-methyltransferase